ncbi:MAG: prepilin-type N-terminal cleavage/methylation domain-containing protein, partial [Planctomycetota bacterium]
MPSSRRTSGSAKKPVSKAINALFLDRERPMQSAKWLMRWSGMKPIQPPARSDRRPAGRRGFTLVELLVVISIIGLLIGIAVPVISKVRGAAEKVTCSSCLRQIGLVVESYTIEHKETYPVARY